MDITFDFSREYILEDDRVRLRPLDRNDLDYLLPFAIQEPEIWQYSLIQPGSEEKMKKYLQLALDARSDRKEYPFIVFDKKSQSYAGSTRFYDIQPDYKTLQLGYTWYGSAYQGTGLNKRCKFLLLQFAFEHMGMVRVEFRADYSNKKSIAAMKSIGCVEEGVLREHLPKPDGSGRRDSIILSILATEWPAIKEKLSAKIYN